MAKHIIEFSKNDSVKYVSHLDMVRMFGRAMRRAGVEISFSQGFNPHPIMNFAHPLGVGISSECELIEIGVESDISSKEFLAKLSGNMPDGFKLLNSKISEEKSPFKRIYYAEYYIEIFDTVPTVKPLLDMKEIITEKKTKSGIKETDIRPLIKSAEVICAEEGHTIIDAVLRCGDTNLKPELFIKVLDMIGCEKNDYYKIHRTAILNESEKPLVEF